MPAHDSDLCPALSDSPRQFQIHNTGTSSSEVCCQRSERPYNMDTYIPVTLSKRSPSAALLHVIFVKRIAAFRSEPRRILQIFWFPAALITTIQWHFQRLFCPTVRAEIAFNCSSTGTCPTCTLYRFWRTALTAEVTGSRCTGSITGSSIHSGSSCICHTASHHGSAGTDGCSIFHFLNLLHVFRIQADRIQCDILDGDTSCTLSSVILNCAMQSRI